MYIVVYNGLGSNRSSIVRLPVSVDASFNVTRLGGNSIQSNLVRSSPTPLLSSKSGAANYVLLFDTGPLAPAGATLFRITKINAETKRQIPLIDEAEPSRRLTATVNEEGDPDDVVATNGIVTVHFDRYVVCRQHGLALLPLFMCSPEAAPQCYRSNHLHIRKQC